MLIPPYAPSAHQHDHFFFLHQYVAARKDCTLRNLRQNSSHNRTGDIDMPVHMDQTAGNRIHELSSFNPPSILICIQSSLDRFRHAIIGRVTMRLAFGYIDRKLWTANCISADYFLPRGLSLPEQTAKYSELPWFRVQLNYHHTFSRNCHRKRMETINLRNNKDSSFRFAFSKSGL